MSKTLRLINSALFVFVLLLAGSLLGVAAGAAVDGGVGPLACPVPQPPPTCNGTIVDTFTGLVCSGSCCQYFGYNRTCDGVPIGWFETFYKPFPGETCVTGVCTIP
jgi:hypothetical protein